MQLFALYARGAREGGGRKEGGGDRQNRTLGMCMRAVHGVCHAMTNLLMLMLQALVMLR